MKILKKVLTVIVSILVFILVAIFLWFAVWNSVKFAVFSDFYNIQHSVTKIPGINDNFVPQGITVTDEYYITSGYMSTDEASRIYHTDTEGNYAFTEIYKDGKPSRMHAGGIADYNDTLFIANSEQIHLLSLDEALTYQHTEITKSIPVNNAASFVFIKNDYLFVGEFNDNEHYITSHPYPSADEDEHRAIVSQYTINSILEEENPDPVAIYSIRDRVQGFAITDEGKIVLSTSWGTSASHFYVYDLGFDPSKELLLPDIEDNNTPVYILDKNNLIEDIKAPSMSEDLDYHDGYVISLSESASNKYIYGKLFFYTDIYALDIK